MVAKQSQLRSWFVRAGLVLGVAVAGAAVIYAVQRPPAPEAATAIQARLELATGSVRIEQGGQGEQAAVSGMALRSEAILSVGEGSRALVRLPDGSSVFVRGGSKLQLGDHQLKLIQGEYWLNSPPTERRALVHVVDDSNISAADSGLSIRRDQDGNTVYVARGMAVVSGKGGRVEVNAGERAVSVGSEAPKVEPQAFWDDWTGGMADFSSGKGIPGAGAGTIYGVDSGAPHGSQTRKLELAKQAVRAVVRGGLSETEVDQTFFNPGGRDVEGWYWFTVPVGASVTGFAVETNGNLVEGEFQAKKEAATNYSAAKASGFAPAILEWVDQNTFRARIFPIESGKSRRVVLRYLELKPVVGELLEYVYPMGRGEAVRIGEFSLTVDLGVEGEGMTIATLADARIEEKGRRVTMRRSGFTPRADFQLEAKVKNRVAPLRVARYSAGGEAADYVMARYTPDIDWAEGEQPQADVVVVVDTSAAGDDASRQLRAQTAEAVLRAMSGNDRFALVSVDVRSTVLHPKEGLAPANDEEIAKALAALAEHSSGGATDLASSFDISLQRLHGTSQPALVYVGDGIVTSGEMSGEQLIERLRRVLTSSRARLFNVAVGAEADRALLSELARSGGGTSLRVEESEQVTAQALELVSQIKLPTLTDFEIDLGAGLDEPFVSNSGKVSKGQEVVVLARTHHDIPSEIKISGVFAGKPFSKAYPMKRDESVVQAFVPRLWAAEYVRRLLGAAQGPDAEQGRISALGLEYGLMTPFTSILALESEYAYANMGIKRSRNPLRGVRLSALSPSEEWRLAQTLAAPKIIDVALGCSNPLDFASKQEAPPAETEGALTSSSTPQVEPTAADNSMADLAAQAAPPSAAEPALPQAAPPMDYEATARAKEEADGNQFGLGSIGGVGRGGGGYSSGPGLGRRAVPSKPAPTQAIPLGEPRLKVAPTLVWVSPLVCSDAAERPLAQRVLVWRKRLATVNSTADLISRYRAAAQSCELTDWRSERAFLELLQGKIQTPDAVGQVFAFLAARPDVQKHLAKLILRRSVDPVLTAAVEAQLFGGLVNWMEADRQLSEIADLEERVAKLKEFIARVPNDPRGDIRLVELLSLAGKQDEALLHGRRLRDRGLMTPQIARKLGDVLARAKRETEAVRTYSEIVEFDPESASSRLLLGDIYLGHAWHDLAYRQYKTLSELSPKNPLGDLRIAAAAAGAGRIDEALRIQRQVMNAEGTPGPDDPRVWARLWSAVRLARLLSELDAGKLKQPGMNRGVIERRLKELQLFSGEGTLVILTWEKLTSEFKLISLDNGKLFSGDETHAPKVGLSAALFANADHARLAYQAQLMSELADDAVGLQRQDITWDGKQFQVRISRTTLPAREVRASLD